VLEVNESKRWCPTTSQRQNTYRRSHDLTPDKLVELVRLVDVARDHTDALHRRAMIEGHLPVMRKLVTARNYMRGSVLRLDELLMDGLATTKDLSYLREQLRGQRRKLAKLDPGLYGHGPQLASSDRKSTMPTPPPSKSHGVPTSSHSASRARKSTIPTLPSLSPPQSHGQGTWNS